MKIQFRQDVNETFMQVEIPIFYEEDYQIRMLQANQIEGLLPMTSKGIDGMSYYAYDVSGMVSMKTQFEKMKLEREDMESFTLRLIQVISNVKNYMLDAGKLMLTPEGIFCKNDKFYFCYLPQTDCGGQGSFHELTEYFVSQVNYEKADAMRLAVELHKMSMEENYDIEQILEKFHEREAKELEESQFEERGNIFELEDEDEAFKTSYQSHADVQTLREMNGALGWIKKNLRHKKREKWGAWDGLMTEGDFLDE